MSISPKAASTLGSIVPSGGTKNADVMRQSPKRTITSAAANCLFSFDNFFI